MSHGNDLQQRSTALSDAHCKLCLAALYKYSYTLQLGNSRLGHSVNASHDFQQIEFQLEVPERKISSNTVASDKTKKTGGFDAVRPTRSARSAALIPVQRMFAQK